MSNSTITTFKRFSSMLKARTGSIMNQKSSSNAAAEAQKNPEQALHDEDDTDSEDDVPWYGDERDQLRMSFQNRLLNLGKSTSQSRRSAGLLTSLLTLQDSDDERDFDSLPERSQTTNFVRNRTVVKCHVPFLHDLASLILTINQK